MGAASQELTERAKLLIAERRYPEAVRACRRALLSDPEHVEVRLLLGEALLALERYDEVRVEMIALSRKAPLRGEVHRLLGEAYLRDHRPMQAIQSLRRALELDPEDDSATELLAEAADETAPVSTTIERWFADEADPTVETDSPAWEEAHTPVPGVRPATLPSETPPPPTIQIDPSFAPVIPRAAAPVRPTDERRDEAPPSSPRPEERRTNPSRPREVVRSRKPTASGFGAPIDPFAPPPRSPRAEAESAPTAGRLAPLPSPGFGAPPRPTPRDEPLSAELTHAARPSSIRDPREPATDDLDLVELDSSEEPVLDLPGAPTNARPPGDPHDRIYEIDDFADEETAAFASSAEGMALVPFPPGPPVHAYPPAPIEPLEPPTIARFETPSIDGGGYGHPPAPPPMAPPGPSSYFPPPPLSAIAEPELLPPPASAPSPPAAAPAPRARQKAIRTEKVGRDRRSLLLPIIGGVGALVAIALTAGLIVWLVLGASEVAEVRERAAAAGDSGARADLEAVIEEIGDDDEPELVALKARLLATLALEHDLDRAAEAQATLAQIPAEERATDAAIAAALLAVERGEAAEATQLISGLTAEGEQIAEGLRTRALATLALGRWDQAAGAAMQAMEARPGAPRHAALYALALHRHQRSAEAITLLEEHPSRNAHPALRVTLARVLSESTRDPERALIEATAVIDELGDAASAHELAVAHLVRATELASRGEGVAAAVAARAAAEHPPPWDPLFGEQLVETFLAAGAAEDANRHLLALAPPIAGNAPARALLSARVALAVGDLDRAEQALAGAGQGLRQSLVSAQVFEARGQLDRARPLYEQAISDPGPEGRRARVRLAAIAMRDGNAARAIELLEPALAAATADLELVPLLARAYLARDRADDASRILTAALSRRADAAELLAARGALELHRGEHAAALASLRQASEARPNDPDLSADLGDAARLAGDATAARAAYDAALAQRADHPRALVGLARLALSAHALDEAAQRLEAAAATGQEQLEVARLRAELFVTRGDGALGVAALEPLARRFDDAAIWTALGDLQSQAELDRDASRSFDRALRADRGYPEALLGRSLIQIRLGSISGATRSIEEAEEQARTRGLTEALAPRIAVAKGRIRFEQASFDRAIELARQALAQDPRCAGAHLLIANAEIERGGSPVEALRAATTGDAPPPEALGRLASRIGRGDEACRLAARYLEVAPGGYDAPDVRDVANGCR